MLWDNVSKIWSIELLFCDGYASQKSNSIYILDNALDNSTPDGDNDFDDNNDDDNNNHNSDNK